MTEKISRDVLMSELARLGVKKAIVEYSGSGDSGQIDSIDLFDDDSAEPNKLLEMVTNIKIKSRHGTWESGEWKVTEKEEFATVQNALDEFCNQAIDERHGGFENNDGGQGEFVFDVDSNTIKYEHSDNIIVRETSEHNL